MSKYPIAKDFHLLNYYKIPMNNLTLPVMKIGSGIFNKKNKPMENLSISEITITTSDNYQLKAILYKPLSENLLPCILYFHGGGFVTKAISLHYELAKRYAKEVNAVVILIDYRLSPKYKYPTSENDCFDAYKWILNNQTKLKIDINKIALAGDSAGGSLCLTTLKNIIDNNLKLPIMQMLIYPVIDNKENRKSMKIYQDTPVWNAINNHKMWKYHLDNQPFPDPFNKKYLIKTYIEIAQFDCLKDEGKDYYNFLIKNNIESTLNETIGTIHGYDFILRSEITKTSINKRINFLKEGFKKNKNDIFDK